MLVVAAGMIFSGGKVLICRRPMSKKLEAGKWEFPGGKREEGESLPETLARELREELDIEIDGARLVDARVKSYEGDVQVLIAFFRVDGFRGALKAKEHSEIKFVNISELTDYELAEADRRAALALIKNREETDAE